MDITLGFLVYATLFRLTIIAVGAASIFLGYRLFIKDPIGQGRATALAEAGSFKLTLRNFWPGAYFAAFGSIIIGLMLWQGNPELILKGLQGGAASGAGTQVVEEVQIRGNGEDEAIDQYWKVLSDPSLPLSRAAEPISRIARIWQQENRTGEALALMRLAVQIEPTNAGYFALLAELFDARGEREKALQAMAAAARRDARFEPELARLRAQAPR
jgi:tetratricopeptide (TPR) repeat protein